MNSRLVNRQNSVCQGIVEAHSDKDNKTTTQVIGPDLSNSPYKLLLCWVLPLMYIYAENNFCFVLWIIMGNAGYYSAHVHIQHWLVDGVLVLLLLMLDQWAEDYCTFYPGVHAVFSVRCTLYLYQSPLMVLPLPLSSCLIVSLFWL